MCRYDNEWKAPVRECKETRFDVYRDGVWYHFTGLEVFKHGVWWGEYYNQENDWYGLFN